MPKTRNHPPHHRRDRRRSNRTRAALTGAFATAIAVVGIATATEGTGYAAAASTQPVTVDSLSINPTAVTPTSTVAASAVVHASRTTSVQALTIAVRSASGANYDFRGAISTTLTSTDKTFTPDSRTFPAGTYTYFVAYEANGVWHNLTPVKTFTSSVAAAQPTATPSTATATPTPSATTPTASATTATPSATATTTTSTPTATASTSHGTLVFSDEFNGSSLDTSKWTANWLGSSGAITPPANGSETECYDPAQVSVGNGEADLSAVAKSCTVNGKTYAYRSGMIQTNGKFNFTHGYAEARLWTPAGTGMWPAFWLDGQSWPTDGEIDVLEAYGTDNSTYHYHYPGGAPGGGTNVAGATAGWHTYAVNWTASTTTWYYDGVQVYSMATQTNSPMYLILNLGLDSSSSAVPATLRADYVRVWQ
jgi:beta-glucanase (GH16 family)